jgi:4-oxalocrotonate tautomerase
VCVDLYTPLSEEYVQRFNDAVVIHIVTSLKRKAMKLACYEILPGVLNQKIGLRLEDIFISLITTERKDWSFGNGKA